jgi:hypothetical protein
MKYINDDIDDYTRRLNELEMDEYQKQMDDDLKVMSDAEWAAKYPQHAEEYLTDEEIKLVKPHLLYLLENSICYIETGGHIPKRKGGGMVPSDLRVNHPPNTVKSHVMTLRPDLVPGGDNAPINDPDSSDPVITIFDADDQEWEPINLRRIHHMFNMNLRKWYPNQHWLLYKFSRFSAEVDYYPDITDMPEKFPSVNSIQMNNHRFRFKANMTLKSDVIPNEPEQDRMPDEPQSARYYPDAEIILWDEDNSEWVTLKIKQIYNIKWEPAESEMPDPRDNPEFRPEDLEHRPEKGRPSNWEEIRDGLETHPRWDDDPDFDPYKPRN